MTERKFSPARFSTDALENAEFEGFTDGTLWNGWTCPYFPFETARAVLTASERCGYKWSYDQQIDAFIVKHTNDPADYEPERFKVLTISVEDRDTKVYAIGAYSWSWTITRSF